MQIINKVSIIIVSCLLLSLIVSCGGGSDSSKENEDNTPQNDSDAAETPENTDDGSFTAEVSSIKFTIPEESSVVADFSAHFAFPDVVKLKSGKFMTVFRSGSTHADKSGSIIVVFSKDGINWEDPDILMDDPSIDDRDPSIAVLSD